MKSLISFFYLFNSFEYFMEDNLDQNQHKFCNVILFSFKDELANLKAETSNLNKQVEVLSSTTAAIQSGETNLQQAISNKNKSFLELRDSFDDVISHKDTVINELRGKVDELRADHLNRSKNSKELLKEQEEADAAKDENLAESARQIAEITKQRDWLKNELERVIAEKEDLSGSMSRRFDSISSGLREDLENAFKDREDYENAFEIHRLQLEQQVKKQSDELSEVRNKLFEKNKSLSEKSTLIRVLEERVEKAADILSKEKYYENLEERLRESDQNVMGLSKSKEELDEKYDQVSHQYENLKVEYELAVSEKNQMKLHGDSKIEEALLNKAEEFQTLRSSFDSTMSEKEKILSNLREKLLTYDQEKDKEICEVKDTAKAEFTSMESEYKGKIETLEQQLHNLLTEKEEKVKQVIVNAEKDRTQQLGVLQADFNTLLNAKDEKIKSLNGQFNDTQQDLLKKESDNAILNEAVQKLNAEREELNVQVEQLKSALQGVERNKESEIEQVIINKGKNLKDLRNEFETVFSEKNKIIEDMRDKMKGLRKELSDANQETREKLETARELEQNITEIETGKIEMEAKVSLLTDTVEELKEELSSSKKENNDQNKYIEQLMKENSNLMSSLDRQPTSELENEAKEKTDLLVHKNVLDNIRTVLSSIPELDVSDSVLDLHESVRKLVILLNELRDSEKTSNDQEGINADMQTLHKRLSHMQNELVSLTAAKENAEEVVRERYEDILANLREDLMEARKGYRSLQEENFALKNQLDVFTNVNAKMLQSSPVPKSRPVILGDVPPPSKVVPKVKSILPEELQQSFSAQQDSFLEQSFDASPIKDNVRLEFIEPAANSSQDTETEIVGEESKTPATDSSHKNVVKLKKLCRKYKDSLYESQEENASLQKELETIKHNLQSSMENTNQEKLRYEKEIQALREEIDAVVVDKSSLVGHFRTRNEEEAAEHRQALFQLQTEHQREIQQLNDRIDSCLHELNARDSIIDQQIHEKEELNKLSEQLRHAQSQRDTVIDDLKSKSRDIESKYSEQADNLKTKNDEISSLQIELDEAKLNVEKLKEELKPRETSSIELDNPRFDEVVIENYKKHAQEFQNQIIDISADKEQAELTISKLTAQIEGLQETLSKSNHEKLASESMLKSLRDDVGGFVEEKEAIIAQWRNRLQNVESERVKSESLLKDEIQTMRDELEAAHGEMSNLNEMLQDQQEQIRDFEARGNAQGDSISDLTRDLANTVKQRDDVQKSLETSRMEVIALQKRMENKAEEIKTLVSALKEQNVSLQENKETINSQSLEIAQITRTADGLRQDLEIVKKEKEELEGRLRRELQQAYDDLVSQNSKLRSDAFTKEKTLQDLRRELGTLVREKEFLQTAMRGQLATSGSSSGNDTEYLRFQVQQLRREKDESSTNFDHMTEELKGKLDETTKEKAAVSLRMATLRAMLEQEVKDHEKTKFLKEQLSQSRGVSLDKLKLSVSSMKDNLQSLKKDMDVNMSGIKGACQEFVLNLAPTMLSVQQKQQQQQQSLNTTTPSKQIAQQSEETGLIKLQLDDKRKQLEEAWAKIKGLQTANRIADSRLRDLVEVLQEIGAIENVQVSNVLCYCR